MLIVCEVLDDYQFDVLDTSDAWMIVWHNGNRKGFAHVYMADNKLINNLKLNL